MIHFVLALLASVTTLAAEPLLIRPSAPKIIRPSPEDSLEVSRFTAVWCAPAETLTVSTVCYGRTFYQGSVGIRSILVDRRSGTKELFLESDWPKIELLKPSFDLVGPVNSSSGARSEFGKCVLSIDQDGEVEAVTLWTPSLGRVQALRSH